MQAMFVSFGMAEAYGGECILRFDDTNPEAEKKEYIDHIQEIVAWMGWSPAQVHLPLHTALHCGGTAFQEGHWACFNSSLCGQDVIKQPDQKCMSCREVVT